MMRWLSAVGLLATSVWAAPPVEDLSHAASSVVPFDDSIEATRPLEERLDRLQKQVEGLQQLDMPAKLSALEARLSTIAGQLEEQRHQLQSFTSNKSAPVDKVDATELYTNALKALKAKDLKQAERLLQQFVSERGDDPLVPGAYYWLGETYVMQNQLDKAKHAFGMLVEHYGQYAKTPQARERLAWIATQSAKAKTS